MRDFAGGVCFLPSVCCIPLDFILEQFSHLSLLRPIIHPSWLRSIITGNLQAVAVSACRSKLVALFAAEFARPTAISSSVLSRSRHGTDKRQVTSDKPLSRACCECPQDDPRSLLDCCFCSDVTEGALRLVWVLRIAGLDCHGP